MPATLTSFASSSTATPVADRSALPDIKAGCSPQAHISVVEDLTENLSRAATTDPDTLGENLGNGEPPCPLFIQISGADLDGISGTDPVGSPYRRINEYLCHRWASCPDRQSVAQSSPLLGVP